MQEPRWGPKMAYILIHFCSCSLNIAENQPPNSYICNFSSFLLPKINIVGIFLFAVVFFLTTEYCLCPHILCLLEDLLCLLRA